MKDNKSTKRVRRKITTPKECFFCKDKKEPGYGDVDSLRKLLTERGKIIGRDRSGLCAKHQRRVSLAVKQARQLALLSFTG